MRPIRETIPLEEARALIEEAFRAGGAKDPEQFRKLAEELWKHSFEALRKVTEEQLREFQSTIQTWMGLASQGAAGMKI